MESGSPTPSSTGHSYEHEPALALGSRAPWHKRAAWTLGLIAQGPRQRRFPYRSAEAIAAAQSRRIRETVTFAHAHVPYYRETMRRAGLDPGDFQSAADLAKLPIIERDALVRDPEYFLSDVEPRENHARLRSGGSTGRPVTVWRDRPASFSRIAVMQRGQAVTDRLAGRRWGRRLATIGPPLSSGALAHRAYMHNRLIRLQRIRRRSFPMRLQAAELVPLLNEFRPDQINSYGSVLEELFSYLVRSGDDFHRPKLVGYAADGLSEQVRKLITVQLGIQVLSAYQAIEVPQIGFECEAHCGYHLNVDVCPLRIVDSRGRDQPAGESGEVIVSDLLNRATVLLNYRLGDIAARLDSACSCGRNLPLLSFVQGRTNDWVEAANGRRVHPQLVHRAFSADQDIWGYSVEQLESGRLRALVVPAAGADSDELRDRITRRFRQTTGMEESPEVAFIPSLPRTGDGKVRRVVSARRARQDSPG